VQSNLSPRPRALANEEESIHAEGFLHRCGAESLGGALLSGDIGEQIQLVARFEGLGPRFDLGK